MDARQSQNELRMKPNSSLAALDDDLEYAQKLYDQLNMSMQQLCSAPDSIDPLNKALL